MTERQTGNTMTEGRGTLSMADFAREAVFALNETMMRIGRLADGVTGTDRQPKEEES